MRISLNWLEQYVDIDVPPDELADRLTMVGLEVESIERLGEKYAKFVVGEVLEVSKHPKANKLTVCQVDIGREALQIVCGAPNVAIGQKVPVGLVGAQVPRDQHDPEGKPFTLSHVKLRGVDSYGMICSEYELDLGEDKDGIMVLNGIAKPGEMLAEYLGLNDIVFDIGVTPNRPDAMSHIGVAREVGALLDTKLEIPGISLKENKKSASKCATVEIRNEDDCQRYTARVILNVKIGPSPKWMQNQLTAVGIRPINNIVDVTNYVLMECGQPLHAFDYDKLAGHGIVVRRAKQGEGFTTLDHKTRSLRADTLMICDREHPVAIAGVMGGENSEISDLTTNVFLESAYFSPRSIRHTSKYLGLSTEASQRFERGADPNITKWAADRAIQLLQETAGGEVLSGFIDVYPKKIAPLEIDVRIDKVNEILGVTLSKETTSSLLLKLSIEEIRSVSNDSRMLRFRVPTFRPDLEREIDLIEEVARVYGYNRIEDKVGSSINYPSHAPEIDFTTELRQSLVGAGWREVIANSMQDVAMASMASDQIVRIANPISKEMTALRTSLIPGILEIVRNNIFHGSSDLRLFEHGKAYFFDSESDHPQIVPNYTEEERLLMVLSGSAYPRHWDEPDRHVDIFDLKGEVESLFDTISLDKVDFIPYSTTEALTEYGLRVEINNEYAGMLGAVRQDVLKKFNVEQDVFIGELLVDVLEQHQQQTKTFQPLVKYPPVTRDIAFILPEEISVAKVEHEIVANCGSLLKKVELFDVYIGEQVGVGNKSCAFALEFLSEERTLSQEEVDRIMKRMIDRLASQLGATIRK